jgi:hypothetical protein
MKTRGHPRICHGFLMAVVVQFDMLRLSAMSHLP